MITVSQAYLALKNSTIMAIDFGSNTGTVRQIETDGETVVVELVSLSGSTVGWFDTLDVTPAAEIRIPAGDYPNRFRWAYRGAIDNATAWRAQGRRTMAAAWMQTAARLRASYIAERRQLLRDLDYAGDHAELPW